MFRQRRHFLCNPHQVVKIQQQNADNVLVKAGKITLWIFVWMGPRIQVRADTGLANITQIPHKSEVKTFEVAPNESRPIELQPLTSLAPNGLYVSVGTERGLIAASLTPQISGIHLLDYDPGAVLYNNLNIALLKVATNREDYLSLRMKSSETDWAARANNAKLSREEQEYLRDPSYFHWWEQATSETSAKPVNRNIWKHFLRPPGTHGNDAFQNANYLFYDNQFEMISRLAKEGKIETGLLDFTQIKEVKKYVDHLENQGQRVSVLDLSNAIEVVINSNNERLPTVMEFSRVAYNNSLLLASYHDFERTPRVHCHHQGCCEPGDC